MRTKTVKDGMAVYDYTYKGQMNSALDSIPLGNGNLGANVWVEDGALYLLLGKTDSFNEWSELLKLGLVKITPEKGSFENPVFHLSLYDGVLDISFDHMKCTCFAGEEGLALLLDCEQERSFRAELVNWRREPLPLPIDTAGFCSAMPKDRSLSQSADVCGSLAPDVLYQYHRNQWSCYDFSLHLQGLEGFDGEDPLLHRTFGFGLWAAGGMEAPEAGNILVSGAKKRHMFRIFARTLQHSGEEEFLEEIEAQADRFRKGQNGEKTQELSAHRAGWNQFWEKSYLFLEGSREAEAVTRGYIYQRYINRCGGKGPLPVKFNGSIFTVHKDPNGVQDYDYRMWGGCYWIQNTRLIYWNMLYSGDFDLMKPLFQMYYDMLPIARYRVREYFDHEGALIPETTTFYGLYSNDNYGFDRSNRAKSYVSIPSISQHYNGQLEIAYMMLKYYGFTGDKAFLQNLAVPFVREILTFFSQHFRDVWGRFCLKNVSALETWKDCINDTPDICGLQAVCGLVLRERAAVGEESPLPALAEKLLEELPEAPRTRIYAEEVFAPCEYAIDKRLTNVEAPELYGVFPYDLYGCLQENEADFEVAGNTYRHRVPYPNEGWRQDGIFAARLGLKEEAFSMVAKAFGAKCPGCAFPAYWGPNYDWIPDQCHGCANSIALTQMLLQSGPEGIRVLPALPEEISVRFRLPAYGGKTVTCEREAGREPDVRVEDGPM